MTLPRETLDNLFHPSTRDPLFIGYALHAQRQAQRIGVDEQARRLGLSLDLLARLALCRTPRPDHYRPDLERVARFVGLTPEAVRRSVRGGAVTTPKGPWLSFSLLIV